MVSRRSRQKLILPQGYHYYDVNHHFSRWYFSRCFIYFCLRVLSTACHRECGVIVFLNIWMIILMFLLIFFLRCFSFAFSRYMAFEDRYSLHFSSCLSTTIHNISLLIFTEQSQYAILAASDGISSFRGEWPIYGKLPGCSLLSTPQAYFISRVASQPQAARLPSPSLLFDYALLVVRFRCFFALY